MHAGLSLAKVSALSLSAAIVATPAALAADEFSMTFETHAAFFSAETKQPKALDPQAFVADAAAPEAVGPQGIEHAAGFRPAFIEQDAPTTPVSKADGRPLGFDLGTWLGASGSVSITREGAGPRLQATFSGLKPGGVYSLFENHFDQMPIGFTPMDGAVKASDFTAGPDGKATVGLPLPHVPTHDNAVLLVYHSDGHTHGMERGPIGVEAHHQLIARPDRGRDARFGSKRAPRKIPPSPHRPLVRDHLAVPRQAARRDADHAALELGHRLQRRRHFRGQGAVVGVGLDP